MGYQAIIIVNLTEARPGSFLYLKAQTIIYPCAPSQAHVNIIRTQEL